MSMKKIVAIIGAVCVVIPTGVFAAGKITGYSSSSADDEFILLMMILRKQRIMPDMILTVQRT